MGSSGPSYPTDTSGRDPNELDPTRYTKEKSL